MTKTISFSFDILNGNEIIARETVNYKVTEKQLREIAVVMDGNGGHRVDLCALEGLTDALEEEIYIHRISEILPGVTDYDGIFVQLQEKMPDELVEAADEFVRMKDVTIPYYIQKDGTEIKREMLFGVSPKEYNAMRKTALSEEERDTDFGLMKRIFPEEYYKVAESVEENAFKECVRDFGQGSRLWSKSFPTRYSSTCSLSLVKQSYLCNQQYLT